MKINHCTFTFQRMPMENVIHEPAVAYKRNYSEQEYLNMVWEDGQRYEYWDGQLVAMAGGSIKHSKITVNIITSLVSKTRLLSCNTFGPDTFLKIPMANMIFLPDIMISCDESDNLADRFLTSPTVIIEVLSDSTEIYDRNQKWDEYRKLKSLRHYLLVSQHAYKVEMFSRSKEHGLYYYQVFEGIDANITIANPGIEVSLKDIYVGVGVGV
jgi:Uma2 family endonuclease